MADKAGGLEVAAVGRLEIEAAEGVVKVYRRALRGLPLGLFGPIGLAFFLAHVCLLLRRKTNGSNPLLRNKVKTAAVG